MNYGYWVFTVSLARAVRCCSRSASRCSWRWGRGWGRAAGTVCTANWLFQQLKHNKLKLQWPPVHPDVVVPAEGGGDHAAMAGMGGGSGLQGQHTGPDQLMYIFIVISDWCITKLKCKHFKVCQLLMRAAPPWPRCCRWSLWPRWPRTGACQSRWSGNYTEIFNIRISLPSKVEAACFIVVN